METHQTTIVRYIYTLPDGSTALNLDEIKVKLGRSKTRVKGMLKSGKITRKVRTQEPLINGCNEDSTGVTQ